MADMIKAERHKVMGANCCMKIYIGNGEEHFYGLRSFKKKIDQIIEFINCQISKNSYYSISLLPENFPANCCQSWGNYISEEMNFCTKRGVRAR